MPETKQVGFQCHAPDQERREFHSRNRVARLPTAWAQEERVPHAPWGKPRKTVGDRGRGGGAPTREWRQNLGQGAPPPPGTHSTPDVPSWPPRRPRSAGPRGTRDPREQPGPNQALPGGSPMPQGLATSLPCWGQNYPQVLLPGAWGGPGRRHAHPLTCSGHMWTLQANTCMSDACSRLRGAQGCDVICSPPEHLLQLKHVED